MAANSELELPSALSLSSPTRSRKGPFRTASSSDNSVLSAQHDKDLDKHEYEEDEPRSERRTGRDKGIIYYYLEFDTELPPLTDVEKSDPNTAPEPPNLKKYESPYNWPTSRKRFVTTVSVISTMTAAFSAGSYSPGIGQMTQEWHISNVAALVGIAIFTAGFGVAPMVLAPFSEINGRKPVFVATGVLFVICQACCAATQSFGGMLISRFLTGCASSTFSTMVGGIVSDIYAAKDRNTPMALFSGAALFGTGLGPLTCAFIAEHTTWRWIFGMQAILDAIMIGAVALCFQETRGSVLLSRKAAKLNKYYEAREEAGYCGADMVLDSMQPHLKTSQRIRWKVRADEERASISQMVRVSLLRPFHLLFTEPVVFFFSVWVSFSWAILYLTLAAIPLVFQTNYGFSLSQANGVFTAMIVGSILAVAGSVYQEQAYDKWVVKQQGLNAADPDRKQSPLARFMTTHASAPERRLFFCCWQSLLLVIGLFMFGWTSFPSIHWIVPSIAITFATIGIFSIYLAVFNYLADAYVQYASSALAAQSFCRNMLGGAFPLVTTQMYRHLGYGPASSLLGGIGAVLTVVPWVLVIYGPKIRERSRFASALA